MNCVCSCPRGAALTTEGRKVAAILAADVVGCSRLMGEDEAGTVQAVSEHREAARPMIFNAIDLPEQRPPSMRSAMTTSRRHKPSSIKVLDWFL